MKIEPGGVIQAGAASALAALLAANVAAAPLTLIPESGDARCAIVVDPAAAGAATAAPDITDRLQNLGIPLIGRYPDGQITQSTYARNVWDMKLHAGRVFIGSGNSANTGPSPNAGPAQVWEIDPATGTSQFSYQIGGEQADVFRVFGDGCLYVPDHDPPGTSSYNCYYKRNLSGVWNKG